MKGDLNVSARDVRLKTEGLAKTMRAFSRAGVDAGDMKALMHSIGMTVVAAARPRTPYRNGDLRKSLRAGHGKTKAVVRAGGRAAVYGPVQHYGWEKRNIRAKPFLTNALAATNDEVLNQLDDGIHAILKKNHLK